MQNLELNRVKVDWITSTEHYYDDDYEFRLTPLVGDGFPSKWLQFKGFVSFDGHIFQGSFLSLGQRNNLACYRVSSYPANVYWERLVGTHCTRLDLAIDLVYPTEFVDVLDEHRTGLKGTSSSFSILRAGERSGFTFNFGSRKSDLFLRVYDKSVESKLSTPNIVRFEVELKARTATKVFELLSEYGTDSKFVQDLFIGFLDKKLKGFPLNDYFQWFCGKEATKVVVPLPVSPPEERIEKYFGYLLNLSLEYPVEFRDELKYFLCRLSSQTDMEVTYE